MPFGEQQQLQELVAAPGHVDGLDALRQQRLLVGLVGLGVGHRAPELRHAGVRGVQVVQALVVVLGLLLQLVVQGVDLGLDGLGLGGEGVDLGLDRLAQGGVGGGKPGTSSTWWAWWSASNQWGRPDGRVVVGVPPSWVVCQDRRGRGRCLRRGRRGSVRAGASSNRPWSLSCSVRGCRRGVRRRCRRLRRSRGGRRLGRGRRLVPPEPAPRSRTRTCPRRAPVAKTSRAGERRTNAVGTGSRPEHAPAIGRGSAGSSQADQPPSQTMQQAHQPKHDLSAVSFLLIGTEQARLVRLLPAPQIAGAWRLRAEPGKRPQAKPST